MSKKFLLGTYLAPYEKMMQHIATAADLRYYEKRVKEKYIHFLKQYMCEYGYSEIIPRVITAIGDMLFEDFLFCDKAHKDIFIRMYHRKTKGYDNKDSLKTAVIYLLSANDTFSMVLESYITNPLYELPIMVEGNIDEDVYSIYHAVKMLLGMKTGLYEEDLLDNEVLSDKVLCLIINAKLIARYGIRGHLNNPDKYKQRYINTPYIHSHKVNTYE